MIPFVTIRIANLPIVLSCWGNGAVSFDKRVANFNPIIDTTDNTVVITDEDILIGGVIVEYDTMYNYRASPELLAWLQAQNLIMPEFYKRELNEY